MWYAKHVTETETSIISYDKEPTFTESELLNGWSFISESEYNTLLADMATIVPIAPEPSAQDDANALLVDHEYRLTLIELGVM